ncbi:hypothetical protein LLEC1_06454 [Akanthomyces lecanii]|uniref:Uncharacterized protein n=1 Tax=Cordyceps confragosa TaxID=2714763 RepID=A0A179IFF0_CORDF|nr:hypothetical protein LLEC1_06454 [Akanthomyces lecanii]
MLATVVSRILGKYDMPLCIIGELALNYYNVPRICHDLEICVPQGSTILAAARLCLSGCFQPCDPEEVNNYTEYKQGFPRLITTFSQDKQRFITIFAADVYGLQPLERNTLPPRDMDGAVSKEMADLPLNETATLPLPQLAPFLAGLATKFLLTNDDNAIIAVEQLVDGMDLDESWMNSQLADRPPTVRDIIIERITGKQSRIDYFSNNQVTCFINDEAEALHLRSIVGYM